MERPPPNPRSRRPRWPPARLPRQVTSPAGLRNRRHTPRGSQRPSRFEEMGGRAAAGRHQPGGVPQQRCRAEAPGTAQPPPGGGRTGSMRSGLDECEPATAQPGGDAGTHVRRFAPRPWSPPLRTAPIGRIRPAPRGRLGALEQGGHLGRVEAPSESRRLCRSRCWITDPSRASRWRPSPRLTCDHGRSLPSLADRFVASGAVQRACSPADAAACPRWTR